MEHYLTEQFLYELLRLCFLKRSVLDIIKNHLKYQYFPKESLKFIYKSIISYYTVNDKLPSYGIISQQFTKNADIQEDLFKIKKADVIEVDVLINELEKYIKSLETQDFVLDTAKLYNEGKLTEAISFAAKESERINSFSLKKEYGYFKRVFEDFSKVQLEKQSKILQDGYVKDKVPFGIRVIDEETYGGIDVTDTACILARSGVGKSTALKWIGTYACRMGYDVLHIQAEGSEEEAFDKYTQVWSAQSYNNVKYGNIDQDMKDKLDKIVRQMRSKERDIFIKAYEQFDEVSCMDIRNLVVDFEKVKGKYPDLILIDYLSLIHPGDGNKYGIDTMSIKMKKENTARKLKNIATEFRTRIVTAEQADGIDKEKWNNPDWCMSRHNVAGAKGLADSFSYFITLNMTEDEEENGIMRLYLDKLRNYHPSNKVVKIATNYMNGRFYDSKRTIELFN